MKKGIIYTIIGILLLIFVIVPLIKFLLGYIVALTSLVSALAVLLIPFVCIFSLQDFFNFFYSKSISKRKRSSYLLIVLGFMVLGLLFLVFVFMTLFFI